MTRRQQLAAGLIVLAFVALAAVGAAAFPSPEDLREDLRDLGALGALVVLALAVVHVAVPYPAELLVLATGYAYGFWAGGALALGAWLVSALVAYRVGVRLGRPVMARLSSERVVARVESLVERGGVSGLLAARLIPLVPFNAVCFACGIARVPLGTYSWTTVVGFAPLTLIVAYLGSRAEDFDVGDPRLWVAVGALLAMLVAARVLGRRV